MDDIAVIGLGLRFPGDASSPEELWSVLENGQSQWSEFPKDRLNIDGYFHPGGDRQGSISFRGAHFLKDDVAAFDAPFFAIAAEDAKAIDPQQRFLLEVAYEAIENAGLKKEDIDGSDTSVYVGSFVKDYEQICLRDPDWQPQYAATGNGIAIMANRISYFFNLHGPSMTIDTGCSGSLVSVHLAAQSLRNKESSLAIAAGAGMILTPNTIMPMTALNFLSPDGKCFTFDSRANGYGRGEGIGVVVLKRLSDAIRDKDTIRAVIRGSSVNQDGRTTGITLPSKEAQIANIRSVYSQSGLDFNQTAYVECHGTGTQAGDWRELKAISETIAADRVSQNPVIVGSVKPNIGHLEGAAGVAGLIKAVLVLERGRIPPNINFEKGNPSIDFEGWKIKVPQSLQQWPLTGLRRVSVNCFGFGGTNAHVILDEAPEYMKSRGITGNHSSLTHASEPAHILENTTYTNDYGEAAKLICYSAHEKLGIERTVKTHQNYMEKKQAGYTNQDLDDYAYTLACRRSNMEWKSFVVTTSAADLTQKLQTFDLESIQRSSKQTIPKIAFVFCGQGSQWPRMGRDLMCYGVFRESIIAANQHLKSLGSSFDILEELTVEESTERLSKPDISQPATTVLQVALVDLMKSFGISPQSVVGHSSGEIAAAYAANAISRYEAWEIAFYRGAAASNLAVQAPGLSGAMMVLGMSLEDTQEYLATCNKDVQVACVNSPRSITVSGQREAIEYISREMKAKGVFSRILDVQIAYHSHHMNLVATDYQEALKNINPQPFLSNVQMFSSVTGEKLGGSELNSSYWAKNMVSPVQFVAAIESLVGQVVAERPNIIIELSPHAVLKSPITDILSGHGLSNHTSYESTLERKKDGSASLLHVIGRLWSLGHVIDMEKLIAGSSSEHHSLKTLSDLPPYPWNHTKSYWHESHLGEANRFREYSRMDLIGAPTADSIPFEPRWRGFLRISESPWIQDHQVQKTVIYPAAGMISMVIEGAKQITKGIDNLLGYEITDMSIEKAMIIPNNEHGLEMALNMNAKDRSGTHQRHYEFAIYAKQLGKSWEHHAKGTLRLKQKIGNWRAAFDKHDQLHIKLEKSCSAHLVPRQVYEHLDTLGMNYGPTFQNIVQASTGLNSCVSTIQVPDTESRMPAKFEYPHVIHPTTLDSMFQTLLAIEPVPMVPTFVKRIFVSSDISGGKGDTFVGHSTASISGIKDADANIVMKKNGQSDSYVVIEGLHLSAITPTAAESNKFLPNHRNLCTEIIWEKDARYAVGSTFEEEITMLAHKHPDLAILQVSASKPLLDKLSNIVAPNMDETPRLSRYTILQADQDAENLAIWGPDEKTPMRPFTEIKNELSDIRSKYHVVIVPYSRVDDNNWVDYLKPEGVLLKLELSSVLERNKPEHESTPAQMQHHSEAITPKRESLDSAVCFETNNDNTAPITDMIVNRQNLVRDDSQLRVVLLLPDETGSDLTNFVNRCKEHIEIESIVSEQDILSDPSLVQGKIVLSLMDFEGSVSRDRSVFDWTQSNFNAFHALQKASKGIIWVTRGAHMDPKNPRGSPIVALARTLMSEDPLKHIATLDLGATTQLGDYKTVSNISAMLDATFRLKVSGPREMEYAEKDGILYIPRLRLVAPLNKLIEDDSSSLRLNHKYFFDRQSDDTPRKSLQLTLTQTGFGEDNLYFIESEVPELGSEEVEITFGEAALTHLDFDTVMGQTCYSSIGIDIKGTVLNIGADVLSVQPGDIVTALVPSGAIRGSVIVKESFVQKSCTEAVPSLTVSAYYALLHIGRARLGSTALVHAGAGAFGLAAIQIAIAAGCQVLATVFGSQKDEQRKTIRSLGVPNERIIDADADTFIEEVAAITDRRGVDIIYNPTQAHVASNFRCIRKCGKIIQFADQSPSHQMAGIPPTSVTLVNLDLRELLSEEPLFFAELIKESAGFVREHNLFKTEQSTASFGISNIQNALKHAGRTPNLGYPVLTASSFENGGLVSVYNSSLTKPLREALESDKTYLLAGGLGGLGRSISDLLVEQGVRHIAYISRSGASSDSAKTFLEKLSSAGVDARIYQADICDEEALNRVVRDQISVDMPAIAGVFQCAAVIKDAVFDNMTYEDWTTAFRPKTQGSWNLVHAVPAAGHDPFFVFLASSAGVIGNRGQANYAAGNMFKDSLSRYCRLQGKRAVSIDLGPVLGAGMLAEDEDILSILKASGFYGIRHEDFLKVIEHAITMETLPGKPTPAQVSLGVGTGGIIRQNEPADPYWSRTALYSYLNLVDMPLPDLSATEGPSNMDVKTRLASCVDADAAADIVCVGLSNMLAKAMNMHVEEIDSGKPPNAYGVDSLVAVGVRNWVLNNCDVQVSVFEVLSDRTVAELSSLIAEKAAFGAE